MTMLTSLRGLLAPSIGQNLRPQLQGAPPTSRARLPSCAALGSAASHTHTEISHLLQHGKSQAQCTLLPVAAAPHKHRWSLKHPRFSAAAQPSNGAAPEEQEEDLNSQDDAVCAPAFVSVDNQKNPNFTVRVFIHNKMVVCFSRPCALREDRLYFNQKSSITTIKHLHEGIRLAKRFNLIRIRFRHSTCRSWKLRFWIIRDS
jgi:hypothetical protein